jgi:hypothetical protein
MKQYEFITIDSLRNYLKNNDKINNRFQTDIFSKLFKTKFN